MFLKIYANRFDLMDKNFKNFLIFKFINCNYQNNHSYNSRKQKAFKIYPF